MGVRRSTRRAEISDSDEKHQSSSPASLPVMGLRVAWNPSSTSSRPKGAEIPDSDHLLSVPSSVEQSPSISTGNDGEPVPVAPAVQALQDGDGSNQAETIFRTSFPNGHHQVFTPGDDDLCGLFALVMSIFLQLALPSRPSVQDLQAIAYSDESIAQALGLGLNAYRYFSVDQLQRFLYVWGRSIGLNLRLGYRMITGILYLCPQSDDADPNAPVHWVWIQTNRQNGSDADSSGDHWSALSPYAVDPAQIPVSLQDLMGAGPVPGDDEADEDDVELEDYVTSCESDYESDEEEEDSFDGTQFEQLDLVNDKGRQNTAKPLLSDTEITAAFLPDRIYAPLTGSLPSFKTKHEAAIDTFFLWLLIAFRFMKDWAMKTSEKEFWQTPLDERPMHGYWFRFWSKANPESILETVRRGIPSQVAAILGNPNLTLQDLARLPSWPSNEALYGVYFNRPSRQYQMDTKTSDFGNHTAGTRQHKVYSGVSHDQRGVVKGRISQHERSTRKPYAKINFRERSYHYRFACVDERPARRWTSANLWRAIFITRNRQLAVLSRLVEATTHALFNLVRHERINSRNGPEVQRFIASMLETVASRTSSRPADLKEHSLNNSFGLTESPGNVNGLHLPRSQPKTSCYKPGCKRRVNQLVEPGNPESGHVCRYHMRELDWYLQAGRCANCLLERTPEAAQFSGSGHTSRCKLCRTYNLQNNGKERPVAANETRKRSTHSTEPCRKCGADPQKSKGKFFGVGADSRCETCWREEYKASLKRPRAPNTTSRQPGSQEPCHSCHKTPAELPGVRFFYVGEASRCSRCREKDIRKAKKDGTWQTGQRPRKSQEACLKCKKTPKDFKKPRFTGTGENSRCHPCRNSESRSRYYVPASESTRRRVYKTPKSRRGPNRSKAQTKADPAISSRLEEDSQQVKRVTRASVGTASKRKRPATPSSDNKSYRETTSSSDNESFIQTSSDNDSPPPKSKRPRRG